jgi:hypothetical protein
LRTSRCLSLLAVLCLTVLASQAQSPTPFVATGLGQATIALDGPWQFHTGDNPTWSSQTLDDSTWENIQVNKPWGTQGHYDYTGYAWYRRHIVIPSPGTAPRELALRMPQVDNAYELYWNGKLIGQLGKLPPHPVWYSKENPQLANFTLGAPTSGILAIRVWSGPHHSFSNGEDGGLNSPPHLGTPDSVAALAKVDDYAQLRSRQYSNALSLFYALIAILAFLAWFRDRSEPVLLWTAAYAASSDLFFFRDLLWPNLSFRPGFGTIGTIISLGDIALWFLLLHLLDLDRRPAITRATRICAWVSITTSLIEGSLQLYDWSQGHAGIYLAGDIIFTLIPTFLELFPLVLVCLALRQRHNLSTWLVAIFALLSTFFQTMPNLLGQAHRYTHWTFAQKINPLLFTINGNEFHADTIAETLLLIAIVYAVCCYAFDQNRRQSALESEFRSAQEIQRILIPDTLPTLPGFAITSAYRPAQEVGGDFFQLIVPESTDANSPGSSLLMLGDVSGKGLKAAMSVSFIVGAIRTAAAISSDPAYVLTSVNSRLAGRLDNGFATCIALRLDPDGTCTVANAGHLPPFLNQHELDAAPALPLGLDPEAIYESTTFYLNIDDRLTLYTDGLLEARNTAGELYGFDRLHELLATKPDAKQATEAAVSFGQEDDITVLTITRLATGIESTTSLEAPTLIPTTA